MRRSTKAARRFSGSRGSIRCRLPPASRRFCAGPNCWWKSKRSPCSFPRPRSRHATALLSGWLALAVGRRRAGRQSVRAGRNPPGPPPAARSSPTPTRRRTCGRFRKFTVPYYENYTKTPEYNGAAPTVRPRPASAVSEVAIGFLGPIENHKDLALGSHAARRATGHRRSQRARRIWRQAVPSEDPQRRRHVGRFQQRDCQDGLRRESLGHARAPSAAIPRISRCAFLCARSCPSSTAPPPIPPFPKPIIPWILTTIQDDRVQATRWRGASYTDLGLKRIGLLRVNERYGRFGVLKFRDAVAPPGAPGGDRAEVRSAGPQLHAGTARDQRFARGWHRAVGRCRRGRHDSQGDAANGDEAAGFRQLRAF